MTTAGPNYPGTATQISNAGTLDGSPWVDGGAVWSNPNNITSGLSGTFATCSNTGGNGEGLWATNYGFSLPSSATIAGILAAVSGKWGGSASKQPTAYIYGLSFLSGLAGTLTDSSQPFTGGPTSLGSYWGASPTYSQINNGSFGFAYQPINFGNAGILSIETFGITVYYTASAGGVQQMLGLLGIGCSFALAAEIARSVTFCQRSIPGGRPPRTFADQVLSAWRRHRGHGWFKRQSILVP
jgi:hypothetical protein